MQDKFSQPQTEVLSGSASDTEKFQKGINVWNNLKLQGAGNVIRAYINNHQVAEYTDEHPITSGRIGLGSSYTHTEFDNLKVMKLKGFVPYYTELLDNMETYDLTSEKKEKLVYDGNWSHANGQGMYVYQRSLSETSEKGASVTYSFTGTGLEILSGLNQDGSVSVTVDGDVVEEDQKLQKAGTMNMTCAVTGLEYQKHTVTFTLKKGTFSVDMVGVLGKICGLEDENTVAGNWKDDRNDNPTVLPTETPVPSGEEEVQIPDLSATAVPTQPQETETPVVTPVPSNVAAAPTASASAGGVPVGEVQTSGKGTLAKNSKAVYRILSEKKKTAVLVRFCNKNAKSAVIPASVRGYRDGKKISYEVVAVDQKAFAGCKNLKKLRIESKKLQKIGRNAFQGIYRKAVFILPSSCRKQYKKLFTAKTGYQKKTMKLKF